MGRLAGPSDLAHAIGSPRIRFTESVIRTRGRKRSCVNSERSQLGRE